ncbi:phage tail assembly chaperone G [Peribacillus sp. SCS-26]|uniref:phage tail assembly chaperone G n=1 Tax=Paraperibacillus marinus TaxID=3115295 RepID=UPI0039069DAD
MANLKRNMIELVKEVKEGEVVTEKYITPVFIPLSVVYEAIDLADGLNQEGQSEKDSMDKLLDFIANKIYKDQFTKEDLFNGIHGPNASAVLWEQLLFVTQGFQTEEAKNYLAKKN